MSSFSRFSSLALGALMAAPSLAQAVDYAALEATMGEPVTTSVIGKPQRASETPASIVIITRDQIIRSPARDVPGLLKTYAGIEVNRWTAGQSDVAVRGGVQTYNARLLVLVNGRQVYLDHYGMTNWNLLGVQLEEIQQIELVRGPSAALFGFNAATGVVNIITVDALAGAHLATSVGLGNHGYSRIGVAATIPIAKNVGMRVSGGRQREDERAIPASQLQIGRPMVKRDEIDASVVGTPDARTRITLDAGYSKNSQLEYLPTQTAAIDRFRTETIGLQGDRDTNWGSLTAHAYLNRLRADYLINGDHLTLTNRTAVAQASALVRLGLNNVLRLGGEYRSNSMDSPNAFSRRIDYKVISGSAMLDLHPSDAISLTMAARADHVMLDQDGAPVQPAANLPADFNRTLTRVSLNAALLVSIGETGQLRVNGGRGYQLPSLIDYGVRLAVPLPLPFPLIITGDPAIDPVPVWSGEIGYTQSLGSGISLDGTIFYTRTNNVIASPGAAAVPQLSVISGPALVARFAAAGDFDTYGIELAVRGKLGDRLNWRANYTYLETDGRLAQPDQLAFAPERTTPRHVANLEIGYRGKGWFSTSVLRYTSATDQFVTSNFGVSGFYHLDDAVALDQKIGFRVARRLTFTLAGENLTKAGGAAGSQIPADRRVRATVIFSL